MRETVMKNRLVLHFLFKYIVSQGNWGRGGLKWGRGGGGLILFHRKINHFTKINEQLEFLTGISQDLISAA